MLDLKLFTDLQGETTASLLLKPSAPGFLQFFVISASVNYSVVVTGECEGELPSQAPVSFDVVLSTIAPLLNKNYQFRLSYVGSILRFVEVNDKFSVSPLCVEHVSDFALETAQRYLDFSSVLTAYEEGQEKLEEATNNLAQVRGNYQQAKILSLSGGPTSNPWGDPSELEDDTAVDKYYKPLIEEAEKRLEAVKGRMPDIRVLSFDEFKRIATVAARSNSTIAMCDTYAVVNLTTAFVVQKANCGTRSIQGKLLRRLISEVTGRFFEYNGELIFVSSAGKGKERSTSVVFLNSYLPNTDINTTIITKGAVKEKYRLNLHGMLQVLSTVSAKFDTMVFDMGASSLRLSNDRGEQLLYKFEVEDAKTIELNKVMRGEAAGDIVMSAIEMPKVVQKILPLLENEFTIYVKERKVILQSGTLYVVFSR